MIGPTSNQAAGGLLRHLIALFSITFLLAVVGVTATDDAGTAYLAAKSQEPDVVTLSSGLLYKVIESGDGAFHPTVDSATVCNYAGTFIDGTEFDSGGATFPPNGVIKGWTEAMQLMVEGDKWELYIPSDLAYGSSGRSGIPPDAALVFTIEMIEIKGGKVPVAISSDTATGGALTSTEGTSTMSAAPRTEAMAAAALVAAFASFFALM